MAYTQEAVGSWRGRHAVDSDGDKIGSIDEIYMDAETGKPEWLAVSTGLFGSKVSFVPIAEASEANGDVRVPYDKQQVKDAPNAEADGELSQEEEAALYGHYGLDYSEARSEFGPSERQGGRRRFNREARRPRHQRPDHRRRDDPLRGGAASGQGQPRARPRAASQVCRHRARPEDGAGAARRGARRARADHRRQRRATPRPARTSPRKSTRSPSTRRRS